MSRLFLLRHSSAGWAQPGMRDIERPLDAGGRADAVVTGREMRRSGHSPAVTLCSTAIRTRETLLGIKTGGVGGGRELFLDTLYSGGVDDYLSMIHEHGTEAPVLVIGHNPVMHDLAYLVCGDGAPAALDAMNTGFPTSGLAVIRVSGSLADLSSGGGFLEAFLKP